MTNDPNDEMLRATRESQGQPMDARLSSSEGRQEAAVLDAKALEKANLAIRERCREIFGRSWSYDTADALAEAAIRAYLAALSTAIPAGNGVPPGMVMLPIEPSDAETKAALDAYWSSVERGCGTMSASFTTNHSMKSALRGSRKFLATSTAGKG